MAFPSGWGYYLPITLDHTKISADLTDWTFVFDQTFASVLTAANGPLDSTGTNPMNSDGSDIRFSADSAGATEIPVDVRTATTAAGGAGTLEVAVKIPTVLSTADTVIYMWWGNSSATLPAASSTYGQYAAYDSNFQQVFSFNGSSPYTDRTAAQATATASGGVFATAAGKIGTAFNITAGGTSLTFSTGLTAAQQSAGATLEILYNWTTGGTAFQNIFAESAASAGLYLTSAGDLIWYNGSQNSIATLTAGTWYLLQILFDAIPDVYAYLDNVLDLTVSNSPQATLNLAGTDASTEEALGFWDEIRVSLVERSTAWLSATYYNIQTNTLSTFGAVTAAATSYSGGSQSNWPSHHRKHRAIMARSRSR